MADLFSIAVKYPLDAISHLIILFPVILGTLRYASLKQESKVFWLYFLCVFVKESIALYTSLQGTPNLYLQNAQSVMDIGFLGLAYYYALVNGKLRKYLILLIGTCLLLSVASFKVDVISPVNQMAGKLFCIVAVLLFFNDMLRELHVVSLARYPMFWLSSGLLVYGTGTFLIALFGQLLASTFTSDDTFDFFWNTQQVLFIIFCLFASTGFWVSRYEGRPKAF